MELSDGAGDVISSKIFSTNPAGDSIVINDSFYEWGMVTMAKFLGIVGFNFTRSRKVTAYGKPNKRYIKKETRLPFYFSRHTEASNPTLIAIPT